MFKQDFSCPALLVRTLNSLLMLRIRGFHPLRPAFPNSSTHTSNKSYQALPLSLAATERISFDFFSFGYLDVSVPQVRFINLCIQLIMTVLLQPGSPIRTSLVKRSFPAHQSFSQDSTSFIASYCQGIHRLRFSSWPYNLNHLLRQYFALLFVISLLSFSHILMHASSLVYAYASIKSKSLAKIILTICTYAYWVAWLLHFFLLYQIFNELWLYQTKIYSVNTL